MTPNFNAINATRARAQRQRETQRISEVARIANQLQTQGLTRTEALKLAEKVVTP